VDEAALVSWIAKMNWCCGRKKNLRVVCRKRGYLISKRYYMLETLPFERTESNS
jgi:hypothetical protein